MVIHEANSHEHRSGWSDSLVSQEVEADSDIEKCDQPLLKQPNNSAADLPRCLSSRQRLCYGVGHMLNDLTASMWFSYLLVFLHQVNSFDSLLAGNLMLIGQVSDAIFTPFIGYESDRTKGIPRIGKRKTWHLVGTLCVMVSFPFLFIECITCSHAPNIAQFVYYASFVIIFQFGWASTQISHLSFSSDYTPHPHERLTLQSIRNMFSVVANLSVYGVFVLLLYMAGEASENSSDLGPADAPRFQNLALISIGLGTVFNFFFYLGTKEKSDTNPKTHDTIQTAANSLEQSTLLHSRMRWIDWLKEHQFYQIATVYMSSRLYINVSQVYFPMYITQTIQMDKVSIAILPLVTYCSSFLVSLAAPFMNRLLGSKITFFVAAMIGASSCVWMYFVTKDSNSIYGCAVLMGASGSLLLITSLAMTSDLISANTESGAFVFGAMSFADKLSNGLAVLLIQKFQPCVTLDLLQCCNECEFYYRIIQSCVPGGALLVALVALATLVPQTIGARIKAVDTLKVLESPARATGSVSRISEVKCRSCGTYLTSTNTYLTFANASNQTCRNCLVRQPLTSQVVDIHRHNESSDDSVSDGEDSRSRQEQRPLLHTNINTPTRDLKSK